MLTMNPFTSVWFWLLILSIIVFIVAFILFETTGETNTSSNSTSPWVWILIAIGFLLWVIALILFAVAMSNYHKCREIAIACGEIEPEMEKIIECPKKGCSRKVECYEETPCGKKRVHFDSDSKPVTQSINQQPSTRVMVAEQPMTQGSTVSIVGNGSIPQQTMNNVTENVTPGGTRVLIENNGSTPIGMGPLPGEEQAFSAAGIQPLASLSPINNI